jgi:hypothetical protein
MQAIRPHHLPQQNKQIQQLIPTKIALIISEHSPQKSRTFVESSLIVISIEIQRFHRMPDLFSALRPPTPPLPLLTPPPPR